MGTALQSWAELHDPETSSLRLRFVVRRKDGSTFPTELSAVGIFEDGEFTGAQGTVRDVSERERLERDRPRVRGALPLARPVVARPHLRDGRPRRVHVLLRPHRGRHRLAAGRADRPPVHRVHRHRGVPAGARAAGRDRGQPGAPVDGPAAHPPQGRAHDPVRGQRRRPGRRRGQLVAIRGVARDISERERLERELRVVRGALPVPRRERAGHRVQRRRRDPLPVHLGHDRAAHGLPAGGA